jgi:hypothetical protein
MYRGATQGTMPRMRNGVCFEKMNTNKCLPFPANMMLDGRTKSKKRRNLPKSFAMVIAYFRRIEKEMIADRFGEISSHHQRFSTTTGRGHAVVPPERGGSPDIHFLLSRR